MFVSFIPSCLCFSPPSLFLRGLRFLNQVSILLMQSLSIIFHQCSYPVILRNILTELQVYYSLSLFFFGGLISSFGVDHIFFFVSHVFPCSKSLPKTLLTVHLSLFNCSGVLKISRRFMFPLCFRSNSFDDVISFKPFKSTGASSLQNRSAVYLFSGP